MDIVQLHTIFKTTLAGYMTPLASPVGLNDNISTFAEAAASYIDINDETLATAQLAGMMNEVHIIAQKANISDDMLPLIFGQERYSAVIRAAELSV